MSSSPSVYISASFYVGNDDLVEELSDKINNSEIATDWQTTYDGSEEGIDGNYSQGYITVFTYLTNGWGDSIKVEEFKSKIGTFKKEVFDFCVQNNYTYPTFLIGANFY